MTRTTLWILRGIALTAFIGFITIILLNLDPFIWRLDGGAGGLTAIIEFANQIRNGLTVVVELLAELAATIAVVIGGLFGQNLVSGPIRDAIITFFQGLGFSLTVNPLEVPGLILTSTYFLGFQLLLLVALLAGILSFLRVSGRLASLTFISAMSMAILGAAGMVLGIPGYSAGFFGTQGLWSISQPVPTMFFIHPIFIVSMISYIYLEASYQVAYFYSLMEPTTLREEQLRRQLGQLRTDAETQMPVERGEIPVPKALQRMLGSDAFRLMREVIEKKLLRREWLVELKDAHEIRRLNAFVNQLFEVDPEAESTLTARAAAPSLPKMATHSIIATIVRFTVITFVSFVVFYPAILLTVLGASSIITGSIDFLFLPEKILILLLPFSLLFPLSASIISRIRQRRLTSITNATGPSSPELAK